VDYADPDLQSTADPAADVVAMAGGPVRGDFRCTACGYHVSVYRTLPWCPMCGGIEWHGVQPAAPWGQSSGPSGRP
jgi:hypothetical protein